MKLLLLAVAVAAVFGVSAFAQDSSSGAGPRILVAFFSKTNNTRTMAEFIRSRVGGTAFHVATRQPYPEDYRETTRIARAEQDSNARPELAATIPPEEMKNYDVVFLGYPNWWGTIPMAMFTFLERHDLSGKTILPFCTHEGSGLGRGPDDIARLSPGATIRQGLAIRGSSIRGAQDQVDNWLRQLGYIK